MAKGKKREKFFLWVEQYEAFKELAQTKGISASELFREASEQFQPPRDFPKKARNLTIAPETDVQIQSVADQWFSSSNTNVPGNRSDVVNYIIMQYLKNKGGS